jgi:hypothetical protein
MRRENGLTVRDQDKPKSAASGTASRAEKLPYVVELRDADGAAVEKVLARAARASLARAIFQAAKDEYPGRRLCLRQGSKTLEDSDANSG